MKLLELKPEGVRPLNSKMSMWENLCYAAPCDEVLKLRCQCSWRCCPILDHSHVRTLHLTSFVAPTIVCLGINIPYLWPAAGWVKVHTKWLDFSLRDSLEPGKRATFKATQSPSQNLGNKILASNDAESKKETLEMLVWKAAVRYWQKLKDYSLVMINSLVKIIGSSPIYRYVLKLTFPTERKKSHKSL